MENFIYMKRLILWSIAAMTLLGACTKSEVEELRPADDSRHRIYATMGEESRVGLNENLKSVWDEGDQILAFGPELLAAYENQSNTGSRNAVFVEVASFEPWDLAYENKYYAAYPYDVFSTILTFTNNSEPAVVFQTSGTQTYREGSYDRLSNLMIAQSEDGENFTFKNMGGYLCLSLTGDKSVRNITLEGNNSETLYGYHYFGVRAHDRCGWYEAHGQSLVLDCGESGVQLTDSAEEFYFVLPPMTFDLGISITIEFTDGSKSYKRTSNSITIQRNHILPMATIETAESAVVWQTITISHSGSSIAAPALYGKASLFYLIDWGDETTSTILDNSLVYHEYSDGKATHNVVIKAQDADVFRHRDCRGITNFDFSQF